MNHISLFSGMGGFDLAAEWMGWNNIAHCEWNPFGQRILKHYWPNAISYHDITKSDFTVHRGYTDVLSGGFPCQPYSMAGKRKGKEDERHLWPHMLRAIRESQPVNVVGENVLGIVSWSGGLVFEEVQADLEAEGYEVQTFILPACAKDAPHQRYRTWFVAHSESNRDRRRLFKLESPDGGEWQPQEHRQNDCKPGDNGTFGNAANANDTGLERGPQAGNLSTGRTECDKQPERRHQRTDWSAFPTQPPVCDGDDGLSGRLDGITFSKWRNESIKAGGNAIVPQVAYEIFKAIQAYEESDMGIGA